MGRSSPALTNFTAGELSPLLEGRVDLSRYFNGARTLKNMTVTPHGVAIRRGGTRFVAEIADSGKEARLIRFQFSTIQAYVLEFGNKTLRFYKDHGQIVNDAGDPYTIETPYRSADLPYINFTQSADVMYIVHSSYAPRKLSRLDHASWTLETVELDDGPFLPINEEKDITITPSGKTGSITLTASTEVFDEGHVDSLWRLRHNGQSITYRFGHQDEESTPLKFKGEFYVSLSPDPTDGWAGKITIQQSFDGGTCWYDVASMTSSRTQDMFEDKTDVWYRAICKPDDYTDGSCTVHVYQKDHWGLVKITAVASATSASADVIVDLGGDLEGHDPAKISNGDEENEDCVDILDWVDADAGTGATAIETFGGLSCFTFATGITAGAGSYAKITKAVAYPPLPRRLVVTAKLYFDAIGTLTANDYFQLKIELLDVALDVAFASDGIYIHDGTSYKLAGTWVAQDTWQVWTFDCNFYARTTAYCDIYLNGTSKVKGFDCSDTGTFINGSIGMTQFGTTTANRVTRLDYLKVGSNFASISTMATTEWREGSFSDYRGWPSCCTFYQDRLIFAATTNNPQTLFASKVGDYENFVPHTADDAAWVMTIQSDQVNAIRWLMPKESLILGTFDSEYSISAAKEGEPLTPTNVQAQRRSSYGSSHIPPVQVGAAIIFVQRARRKVRELTYTYESDTFTAPDLTLLSDHITMGGLREIAYQHEPDPTLWCARTDGMLVAMTYMRSEEVLAWHQHQTDGEVESVVTIPASGKDELWLIVERTIGGNARRFIEYMEGARYGLDFEDQVDCFHVDCGLTYEGASATVISGLDHLEGAVVDIMADGSAHQQRTVSDGSVTLTRAASKVHVGLPYQSVLETMRLEGGSPEGTSQGKIKRIHEATIRFFKTLGAKYGPSAETLEVIPFRSSRDNMDTALPLFTGDKTFSFNSDYDIDCRVYIVQEQPLPMTVAAIFPRLTTY